MSEVQLVYQVGIANLFAERDGVLARVYQGDFRTAENMARGAKLMGASVRIWHCDQAGDIANRTWGSGRGEIFEESKAKRI